MHIHACHTSYLYLVSIFFPKVQQLVFSPRCAITGHHVELQDLRLPKALGLLVVLKKARRSVARTFDPLWRTFQVRWMLDILPPPKKNHLKGLIFRQPERRVPGLESLNDQPCRPVCERRPPISKTITSKVGVFFVILGVVCRIYRKCKP